MTDIENSEPALVPVTNRAPVRADSPTFAELGVRAETVEALAKAGITRAFAIQEYALPIALRGTDLIGQAPTGTGKTLGFGLPMLERLLAPSEGADGVPQALVVVPTRELGLQVARDLAAAGSTRGVRVLPIYGGVAYEPQVDALKKGVEILVGTPGRLLDLAKQKQLKLGGVKTLVLDEADRMLDLGFLDDVEKILAMLPEQRQTMLFSATMPDPIVALSRRFLHHPVTIHAGHTADSGPSPLTKQVVYRTHPLNKVEMIARILQARGRGLTMIFTRTKRAADRLAEDLDFRGFAVAAVHGDLGQGARERALRAFRSGKIDVLVATDVAARGLDVSGVTHVINYDCPEDPETYTHRIGRTGRAGATGVAVTFVDWEDMPRWVLIDKTLGLGMPQPPETYHTSAALYSDLDIPTDISGTLPTADRNRAGLAAEIEEDLGGGGRRRDRDRGRGSSRRGRPDSSGPSFGSSSGSPSGPSSDGGDDRPKRQRRRRRAGDEVSGTPEGPAVDSPESSGTAVEDATAPRTRSRRRRTSSDTVPTSVDGAPAEEITSAARTRSHRRVTDESTDAAPATIGESASTDAPAARTRSRRRLADDAPAAIEESASTEAPATRTRSRRQLVDDAPSTDAPDARTRSRRRLADDASVVVEESASADAPAADIAPAARTRSRRRVTEELTDAAPATAEEADSPVAEIAPAARARSRRRVTDDSTDAAPATEEPAPAARTGSRRRVSEEPASESASVEEAAPVARTRSRRTVAEESVEAAEESATAPRARGRRLAPAAAAPVEAPAESEPAAELETAAKRTRRKATAAPVAETAADAAEDAAPPRTRRRAAPAIMPLFSDGSDHVGAVSSAEADDEPESDDADQPKRKRRRGTRGNRGSGSGAADMTGGSEAGVGTTV
jgi:superfamily II DNA/RNA helicase